MSEESEGDVMGEGEKGTERGVESQAFSFPFVAGFNKLTGLEWGRAG